MDKPRRYFPFSDSIKQAKLAEREAAARRQPDAGVVVGSAWAVWYEGADGKKGWVREHEQWPALYGSEELAARLCFLPGYTPKPLSIVTNLPASPVPASVRAATLEEAAQVCEAAEGRPIERQHAGDVLYLINDTPQKCASAIRALASKPVEVGVDAVRTAAQAYVDAVNSPHVSAAQEQRCLIALEAALASKEQEVK